MSTPSNKIKRMSIPSSEAMETLILKIIFLDKEIFKNMSEKEIKDIKEQIKEEVVKYVSNPSLYTVNPYNNINKLIHKAAQVAYGEDEDIDKAVIFSDKKNENKDENDSKKTGKYRGKK